MILNDTFEKLQHVNMIWSLNLNRTIFSDKIFKKLTLNSKIAQTLHRQDPKDLGCLFPIHKSCQIKQH